MKLSEWVLGGKWALVGGIAALGVVGLQSAIAQEKLVRPLPPPEGLRAIGKYEPNDWPQLRFAVTIQNTAAVQRDVRGTATLVKTVFKGNPAARTIRPGDIETTELGRKPFQVSLKAGGEKSLTFGFDARPDQTAREPGMPRVTYSLRLMTDDGRMLCGVGAAPPPIRSGANLPLGRY